MLLKLSPSLLEKFRLYMMEEYFGKITSADVITAIKGEEKWTPKAEFGTAFHLVMENGAAKYWNQSAGKYVIQGDRMPGAVICEYSEIELADQFHERYKDAMVWEIRHQERVRVDHYDIILSMRIDAMYGLEVHENKTKEGSADPKFYDRSLQWKCYLWSMGTPKVQYNVFPYKAPSELKEGQTKRRAGAREIREVSYMPMQFFHGGEPMIQEVEHWIRSLIGFAERQGVLHHLIVPNGK